MTGSDSYVRRNTRQLLFSVALTACWAWSLCCSSAEARETDLGALTRETQQQFQDATKLEILWWLPVELWAAVLQGDPPGTTRSEALDSFDRHLIFFVAEANISPLGNLTFEDPEKTRKRVHLLDLDGKKLSPLPEDSVPSDLRILLNTLLPALASSAGAVGQNFQPFVFASKNAAGKRIASPREPGMLRVALGDRTFRWRLPLASLLPPKRCPVDDEELSGAFVYCPYHGNKLDATKGEGSAVRAPNSKPSE